MSKKLTFSKLTPAASPGDMEQVKALLNANDLKLDAKVEFFVVCWEEKRIVACAGLDENVIKDVAVAAEYRGGSLSLRLGSELIKLAAENGHMHLFLCCQPDKVELFRGWGFYPLVEIPGRIALMENSSVAMKRYCDALAAERKPGQAIGCVVLNANPFTLGHAYLCRKASAECDWLHVFVVKEDASQFSYSDRFALVTEGLKGVEKLTVHQGSDYIISRATFPGYFLKDEAAVDDSWTGIDLLVFRNFIAPALGITRRYVGTEAGDPTTDKYNADMKQWLKGDASPAGPVDTVVVPRECSGGAPISASTVRSLLAQRAFDRIGPLVPPSTLAFLNEAPPNRTSTSGKDQE